MPGKFTLTGKVNQVTKDGVDVGIDQDKTVLTGWTATLTSNYPKGVPLPDSDDIDYIDVRNITLLSDGSITEDGTNAGVSLTAHDPDIFSTPLQWTIKPGTVTLTSGKTLRPKSWTFNALLDGESATLGGVTPVAATPLLPVPGDATWDSVTGKPPFLASGSTALEARTAIGLDQINNTADSAKPVSTAQQAALDLKAPFRDTFDVIVIGATEVGVMTALAAARQGCTVLLVGQNERIGGNVGYGITRQDIIASMSPMILTGVTREFFSRVARQNKVNGEFGRWWRNGGPTKPSWTKRTFMEMIGEQRHITTLMSQTLDSVQKSGTTITSVTLSGRRYTGTVIVDATPTGDVAQKSGCTTSIGREGNTLYTETNAGVTTPVAIGGGTVDPYVTAGNSGSGLLPGVSSRALGTANAADTGVMTTGWRLYITSVAGEMVAWPASPPTGYNAQNYELMARMWASSAAFYNATDGSYTSAPWQAFSRTFQMYSIEGGDGVTGVPTYGDLNSVGSPSSNYPNAEESLEYVTATPARRAVIEANALAYLKGLFYFITQSADSRIPANLKTAVNAIGLSNLELPEYGGWNPNFYIREGARIVGDYVMKSSDLGFTSPVTDAIGYFCYDFDSHAVRVLVNSGVAAMEGGISSSAGVSLYGTLVPMRVLFPKVTECTNLLCPGQPSVSRKVYVGLRATTTMMQLGEGAGYVAADAVRNKTTVQAVNSLRVKAMQNLAGLANVHNATSAAADFSYGPGMAVSEGGSGAAFAAVTGSNVRFGPHQAANIITTATAGCALQSVAAGVDRYKRFVPAVLKPGRYKVVHVYAPTASGDTVTRATNVQVTITHADGVSTRVHSQQFPGPGVGFDELGDFYFPYNPSGLTTVGTYIDINTDGLNSNGTVVAGILALFAVDDITKAVNA